MILSAGTDGILGKRNANSDREINGISCIHNFPLVLSILGRPDFETDHRSLCYTYVPFCCSASELQCVKSFVGVCLFSVTKFANMKTSLPSESSTASYYYYQILLIIITLPHFVRLRPPSCHAVRASVVHVQTVRRQSQRGVQRSTPKKAAPCLYLASGCYG